MSKKYSSFKDFQLITENWRKYINEEEAPAAQSPADAMLAKLGNDLTAGGVVKVVDFLNSPTG